MVVIKRVDCIRRKRRKMFLEIHCSPFITLCLESIGIDGVIN